MKEQKFNQILSSLKKLNRSQDRILKDEINKIDQKKIVAKSLETPFEYLECFHCKSKKFIRWGYQSDLQRYKCKKCNKTFNSLSGSPLAKLKRKGHWLEYSKCLILGKTIRKSASLCDISKSTSFRWRHRFLIASKHMDVDNFKGVVEFYDQKEKLNFKGSKNIPPKYVKNRPEITVLYCKDRSNNSKSVIFNDFTELNISKKLSRILTKDLLFCTDNLNIYHEFSKKTKLRHGFINIQKKEYVKKEIIHLNNINKYFENYDIWRKRFHGVATKYLKNYLSWFRTLDEFTYRIQPINILLRAKGVYVKPTKDEYIFSFNKPITLPNQSKQNSS